MKPIYKIAIVVLIVVSYYQNKAITELQQNNNKQEVINIFVHGSSFGELDKIPKNHRALVVAIAMTESNCNYSVKHPTKETKGIGGIKPTQWCLKSNVNSLMAIDEIITQLEDQGKSPYEIILFYKGAKINLKSTNQCYDLYLRLKGIL
jgi:hypothetical protein